MRLDATPITRPVLPDEIGSVGYTEHRPGAAGSTVVRGVYAEPNRTLAMGDVIKDYVRDARGNESGNGYSFYKTPESLRQARDGLAQIVVDSGILTLPTSEYVSDDDERPGYGVGDRGVDPNRGYVVVTVGNHGRTTDDPDAVGILRAYRAPIDAIPPQMQAVIDALQAYGALVEQHGPPFNRRT